MYTAALVVYIAFAMSTVLTTDTLSTTLTLFTLSLIAHLDRANIGNAKIEGLETSLGMKGTDYNIVVGR